VRIAIRRAALKSALRWGRWVLAVFAVIALGCCGLFLADGWLFQQRERRHFDRLLRDRQAESGATSRVLPSAASKGPAAVAPGGLIGRLEIPRLGLSLIVAEGVDALTLRRAVGHIPGTGMPGKPGNIGLAGHRDTLFRSLRNVLPNDVITLTTPIGAYRYRVVSTKVVRPADVGVLEPNGSEVLTLVTCYPFYYVGPAPDRFIVRAERIA
jgi:sortase A